MTLNEVANHVVFTDGHLEAAAVPLPPRPRRPPCGPLVCAPPEHAPGTARRDDDAFGPASAPRPRGRTEQFLPAALAGYGDDDARQQFVDTAVEIQSITHSLTGSVTCCSTCRRDWR
ncbi:hypothetical protein C8039_01410 [Halogeometricum sp. wsp3]|nr:hypothetical protein C8039_01410 [Halogeometricum sp. wsp3]